MISYQEFLLILSKVLIIEASLHASTAENELQQYKFRNNILHETLIKEGCLNERVGKAKDIKDMPEDEERVEAQLEIKLYEELTTRLIECRQAKQGTTTRLSNTPTTSTPTPTLELINYNNNLASHNYRKSSMHCS